MFQKNVTKYKIKKVVFQSVFLYFNNKSNLYTFQIFEQTLWKGSCFHCFPKNSNNNNNNNYNENNNYNNSSSSN